MVFIQNQTTSQINELPTTGGRLLYDTTKNKLVFRDGVATSEVLFSSSTGLSGINTSNPDTALEVNSTTGNNLRLTYNDSNGSAVNYTDFLVSSSGDLTITPSGLDVNISTHDGTNGLKLGGVTVTATATELNTLDGITSSTAELNILDGVTATASEINYLDLTTGPGTAEANKALVLNGSSNITGINSLTTTSLVATNINLTGLLTQFSEGKLIINGYSSTNMNGNLIHQSLITDIDLNDYNPNSQADNYSIEIIGYIKPQYTETYTFHLTTDTGVRLWVNDILLYNNWIGGASDASSTTIALTAGEWYPIRIHHTHGTGTQDLLVQWSSTSQTKANISSTRMAWDNTENQININPTHAADKITIYNSTTDTSQTASLSIDATSQLTMSSPNYVSKLFLGSNMQLTGPSTNGYIWMSTADCIIESSNAIKLGVQIDNTPTLLVYKAGKKIGINASDPAKALEINSETGACLRLTYNDTDGNAVNYSDLEVTSGGGLNMTSTSHITITPTSNGIIYGKGKLYGDSDSNATDAFLVRNASNVNVILADTTNSKVGVNIDTNAISKALDINSTTGDCMRLIYNDRDGSPTNYVDLLVTSSGDFTITPSGLDVNISTHNGTNGLQLGGVTVTATAAELNTLDGITSSTAELNILDGVTATAAEINYLDLTTGPGTAEASKALVLDSSSNITAINNVTITGIFSSSNTTASTSNTTGSITLAGGIGISNTTNATSNTNGGSFTTAGGAAIAKNLYVGANAVITGNLTVNGTTTTVESVTTVITDNTLLLNSGPSGSGRDAGIITQRYQIANNAGTGDVVSDTAKVSFALDAATSTTITLPSGANATDDYYNNWWIKITSGSAANEVRQITDYVGSTKVATLATAFTTTPSASDNVSLYNKPYTTLIWQEANNTFISAFVATDITGALNIIDNADFTCNKLTSSDLSTATLDVTAHNGSTTGLKLNGTLVTSTAAELNILDGVTATASEINYLDLTTGPGTAEASKALVLNSSSNITGINSLSATSLTGTLQTAAQTNITSVGNLTSLTVDGIQIIDVTNTEALLVRKDADGGDIFAVDTTNSYVNIVSHNGSTTGLRLNGTLVTSTAAELNILDGVTATAAEINYLDLTTGPGTAEASKALVLDSSSNITGINSLSATSLTGTLQTAAQTNITSVGNLTSLTVDGIQIIDVTNTEALLVRKDADGGDIFAVDTTNSYVNIVSHNGSTTGLRLNGTLVTSTAAELNILDGVTATAAEINYLDLTTGPGTAEANKALVLNGSSNITGINSLTATTISVTNINLTGLLTQFGEGYLVINGYSATNMNGNLIHQSLISDIDLNDYNPNSQADNYSIEIIGYIKPQYTETYTFHLTTDTGIRLWVNDVLLYNNWVGGASDASSTTIALTAGVWYPIRIHHTHGTGTQDLLVQWSSTSQTKANISSTRMAWDNTENQININPVQIPDKLTLYDPTSDSSQIIEMDLNSNGDLSINSTSNTDILHIRTSYPSVGINTSSSNRALEINESTGQCLRLTYNDNNGGAVNYTDLTVTSNGGLYIQSTGNVIIEPSGAAPKTTNYGKLQIQPNASSTDTFIVDAAGGVKTFIVDTTNSKAGINVDLNVISKSLDINSSSGDCMRLIYNDRDGSPTNYVDFLVTSSGDLTITPSGLDVNISTHNGTNGLKLGGVTVTSTAAELNILDGVTATAAELNYLDLTTGPGTAEASKALVLNGSSNITGINSLTSTTINTTDLNTTGNVIFTKDNATGNTTLCPLILTRTTSATPADGLGVCLQFNIENSVNTNTNYGKIEVTADDITDATEDGKFTFRLISGGTEDTSVATLESNGTFSCNNLVETSDRRVKENIISANIEDSYNKIMDIHLVDYNFINDKQKRIHRGVIAQELQEIIPNAVENIGERNGIENFCAVSNRELIGFLIGSVQHLNKIIKDQENIINNLKNNL
jgi:hypothetical protein